MEHVSEISQAAQKPAQPAKRTRICGPQSKTGCYTCKRRRIKCDEEKPACLRCSRSGMKCDGYREKAVGSMITQATNPSSQQDQNSPSTLRVALRDGLHRSSKQDALARLGCDVLSYAPAGQLRFTLIHVLLPQLSHSIPAVNAAAATLGAILTGDDLSAAKQYGAAIRIVYDDLHQQPFGPIPTLVACVLLALSEVLLGHERNALIHLHGAYKLLKDQRILNPSTISTTPDSTDSEDEMIEDDISALFRTLDIQTCSYALARSADMPTKSIPRSMPVMMDLDSGRTYLISITHNCYDFAARAVHYKYRPYEASAELFVEQGRLIGSLSLWLEKFNFSVIRPFAENSDSHLSSSYANALVLRMTCLSILIYLATILRPLQTAYDSYSSHFDQIIKDGTEISTSRNEASDTSALPSDRLSIGPGIIQPLFLTALKYRNPTQRRRAVDLIKPAGREGPWHGPTEATVARRLIEAEEKWPCEKGSATGGWGIPEVARVHGCFMRPIDQKKHFMIAQFSRCRDVAAMVSDMSTNPTEKYNDKWWDVWEEVLDTSE